MSDLNLRIIAKGSSTAGESPAAGDLDVGELAINTADKTIFTKHSDGSIVTLGGGAGGGGAENLDELLDVDLTTNAPVTGGQGLLYNATAAKWENADIAISVNGESGYVSLGVQDMDDVIVPDVTNYSTTVYTFIGTTDDATTGIPDGYWRIHPTHGWEVAKLSSDDPAGDLTNTWPNNDFYWKYSGDVSWTFVQITGSSQLFGGTYINNWFRLSGGTANWPTDDSKVIQIAFADPGDATLSFSANDFLKWDGVQGAFVAQQLDNIALTGNYRIQDATDYDADTAVADGDFLQYVSADNEFRPTQLATVATSGDYADLLNAPTIPDVLDDLSDVDVSTTPPTDGQVLKWNNSASQWEAGNALGSGSLVNSVNDQTGDVDLDIQDMNDYQATTIVQTEYTWSHEASGGSGFAVGEWGYDTQNSGTTSRIKIALQDDLGNDFTGQVSAGQTIWCSTKGRTAVAFVVDSVNQTQFNSVDIYFLNAADINEIGGGPFVENDSLVITLAEPGSDAPLVDGDILAWNNSIQKFQPGQPLVKSINGFTGDITLSLDGLSDVDQSGVLDEQTIIWDQTNTEWIAGYPLLSDPSGTDGTRAGRKINELADVSRTAPQDGQVLQYDAASSSYVPTDTADSILLETLDLTDIGLNVEPSTIGDFAWDTKLSTGSPGAGEWALSSLRWGSTDSRGASWTTTGSTTFWATTNGVDWYEETANVQYISADDYYYINIAEMTVLHTRIDNEGWQVLYFSLTEPGTPTTIPYAADDFLKWDAIRNSFVPTQLDGGIDGGSFGSG